MENFTNPLASLTKNPEHANRKWLLTIDNCPPFSPSRRPLSNSKTDMQVARADRRLATLRTTSRGFCAWRDRPMSQRQRDDMAILAHIREQRRLSLGSYGRPRMTDELRELGLNAGHRRVGRLMRENAIKAVRTRKDKATTDSNHAFAIAPNILDRDFSADAPNRKWAGGISYIRTGEGWLYLAVILDLYSRRVIGRAVSGRLKRDLAIRTLDMAVALRQPPPGCIHHTGRGSQYCSGDYQKSLKKHSFPVSMSGKGNCCERALSRHWSERQWRAPPSRPSSRP